MSTTSESTMPGPTQPTNKLSNYRTPGFKLIPPKPPKRPRRPKPEPFIVGDEPTYVVKDSGIGLTPLISGVALSMLLMPFSIIFACLALLVWLTLCGIVDTVENGV